MKKFLSTELFLFLITVVILFLVVVLSWDNTIWILFKSWILFIVIPLLLQVIGIYLLFLFIRDDNDASYRSVFTNNNFVLGFIIYMISSLTYIYFFPKLIDFIDVFHLLLSISIPILILIISGTIFVRSKIFQESYYKITYYIFSFIYTIFILLYASILLYTLIIFLFYILSGAH